MLKRAVLFFCYPLKSLERKISFSFDIISPKFSFTETKISDTLRFKFSADMTAEEPNVRLVSSTKLKDNCLNCQTVFVLVRPVSHVFVQNSS